MTIGHSTRNIESFIEMLRANGVKRVVDVRTIPRSRIVKSQAAANAYLIGGIRAAEQGAQPSKRLLIGRVGLLLE